MRLIDVESGLSMSQVMKREAWESSAVSSRKNDVASHHHHTTVSSGSDDGGSLVKSLVFGGLDGIITTFAIVATVAGARAHAGLVLLMGAANLIADATSMGIGDFLSERAEDEYIETTYQRELGAVRSNRPHMAAQLEASYSEAGLDPSAARAAAEALSTVDEVLAAHSMLVHQQMMAPGEWRRAAGSRAGEGRSVAENEALWCAAKKGATTAAAFVVFGATPLMAYYALSLTKEPPSNQSMFTASCVVTTTTLLCLGAAKAKLTEQPLLESAVAMVVNGGAAALAAFAIGRCLEDFESWHDLAVGGSSPAKLFPAHDESSSSSSFPDDASSPPLVAGRNKNPAEDVLLTMAAGGDFKAAAAAHGPTSGAAASVVFLETLVASLFSVLGALPTFFLAGGRDGPGRTELPASFVAIANAIAGGAVAAISLSLAADAAGDDKRLAGLGFAFGITAAIARLVVGGGDHDDDDDDEDGKDGTATKSISTLAIALASHSAAEGLALGAAYSHSYARGRTAALSILVHNVPEGLATATVVLGRGKSPLFAAVCAFAAASPQPLGAVLASAFAGLFAGLSSLFVAFAAAMMLWISLAELIPDALDAADKQRKLRKPGPSRDLVAVVAAASALVAALSLS